MKASIATGRGALATRSRGPAGARWRGVAAGLLVAALAALPAGAQGGLSPAEANGKQIYRDGTSRRDTALTAVVGTEGVTLPASAVPCASCHGTDGTGRPEGGVIPPDIRWRELTKVYGHVHEDGRRHPPFDEESLEAVIRTGIDPAGNQLDRSMPIYAMPDEDMKDLLAYLRKLESDFDPGVTADRVQVATLVPLDGPRGPTGRAMAQALHGYFADLNAGGGVFSRQVDLLVVPHGRTAGDTIDTLRLALGREGVFALVGAYTVGIDQPLLELLGEDALPLVGPFTLDPGDEILNTNAFYIYAGFAEQARVLAEQALAERGSSAVPMVVAGPAGEQTARLAAAVRRQVAGRAAAEPVVFDYPAGEMDAAALAAQVAEGGGEDLLFFGDQAELDALLGALAQRQSHPRVYLLGTLVAPPYDGPAPFNGRVYLAHPTLPADVSEAGRAEYQRLAQRHALPPDHVQGQLAALAAAKLFVAALREAGRELTREGFEEALEGLYQYRTGLTPPLTYGPTRRVGARGAYVTVVDMLTRRQRPAGPWVDLK